LFLSDCGDRSQHDRGGNRQLDRECGKPKGAADCPGGAGKPRMEFAPTRKPVILEAEQGDIECSLERKLGRLYNGGGGGGGECTWDKPDRLAGKSRQAAGKAGAFEPPHRRGESVLIRCR